VRLRYLELLGENIAFPEDHYQGEYIKDIARHLLENHGDSLKSESAEGIFKQTAENEIFEDIRKSLGRMGVHHDVFFNENALYETGQVEEVIRLLKEKNLAYDKDGAVWFRATAFKGEKDKVIVKNTGEPTYRLPDIAYHRDKINRGFKLIIDILGADHVATYPDVLAGVKALGYDESGIKVLIHQFVTIMQGGEVVKMSTRKANFITLDELMDEVGPDVVRYFFLMRSMGSHLNFDLALAKEESEENPVYYLQYAHARIAGIIRHAESQGFDLAKPYDPSVLSASEEISLIKLLGELPVLSRTPRGDGRQGIIQRANCSLPGGENRACQWLCHSWNQRPGKNVNRTCDCCRICSRISEGVEFFPLFYYILTAIIISHQGNILRF
jgi:arginyl-tRNA synthetase